MGSPLERGGACPCRLRRCALFSLAVVIVFAVAPGVCSAAEKGLSVDLTWGTSSSDQDRTAAMLPDTGAKWVRLTFDWSQLETSKGSYSSSTLATYDRAVSLSRQAGMNVDVTVYNSPKWASANGQTSGPPANNADYASIMSFLASTRNVVIQDLTFDSPWKPINNIANKPPADGIFTSGADHASSTSTSR